MARFRHFAFAALAAVPVLATPAAVAPAAAAAAPAPAPAAAPVKAELLARWTQDSALSAREWAAARRDRARWAPYSFNWSTDQCTRAPERPLGFDFRLACVRHDFGYRNYRATGTLAAHRPRLDRAFRSDMFRRCATYVLLVRPVCQLTATTYYQAARRYGDASVLEPR